MQAAEDAYARLVAKATRSTSSNLASDLQQAIAAALDAVSQALSTASAPVIPSASPLQEDPASASSPDFIPLPEHDSEADATACVVGAAQTDRSMPDDAARTTSSGGDSAKSLRAEHQPDGPVVQLKDITAEGAESEVHATPKPVHDKSSPPATPSETYGARAVAADPAVATADKLNAVMTDAAKSTDHPKSAVLDPAGDQQSVAGDADAFEIATPTGKGLLARKSFGSRAKGTPVRKGRRSILGNISNLIRGSSQPGV